MRHPHPIRSIPVAQLYLFLHFPKNLPIFSTRSNFLRRLPPQSCRRCRRLSFTMAGESENFSSSAEENAKYGFEREEMHKTSLAGTVDPYDRHVFLCYKSHESWPARVEDSDSDPFPKLFAGALKARKNDINVKTRLTICGQNNDASLSDGDVLIFPDMILYRGLLESDVESFVQDVLVDEKSWQSGEPEQLTGSYVFVCAHNNRDRRCGVCGPALIEKFNEEIRSRDLNNSVVVNTCSHIGGHKYAGNVIIFSAGSDVKVAGNWYGYVTPNDVPDLLEKQIGKGEIIDRIWRGQMGANVKEAEKVEEPKLANGTNANNNEKQPEEIAIEEITTGGCCQGTRGFSCCRDENVEKNEGGSRFACWTGKLEQRHVLTTVAVVGAVAAVAVAFGVYKRAR